jgi:Domain of unknown function (DUF4105)
MAVASLLGALAIYYATLQPGWLRLSLTGLFATISIFAILVLPFRRGLLVWCAAAAALTAWYFQDRPSNDRDWAAEYAIPASASRAGRTVFVQNVRNFTYRSETDVTPAYYDASFRLDDLATLDLVTSYWAGDAIAHVFLTFGFRDGRYLAFSIETRRQSGFGYSTLAGFFHHYELFYVVADERDLIGVRTDVRHERVYLYRLVTTPQVREALFLSYLDKVTELARHPEWYNTLTDNCTTGILARASTVSGGLRYNWRLLASGHAAEYAYSLGLLGANMPFAELQRRSLIVRPANAAIGADYSQQIRKALSLEKAGWNFRPDARAVAYPWKVLWANAMLTFPPDHLVEADQGPVWNDIKQVK